MAVKIPAAVAEAERARILECANEGRSAALAAGVSVGRKTHHKTREVQPLIGKGAAYREIAQSTGVSATTFFRIKKALLSVDTANKN